DSSETIELQKAARLAGNGLAWMCNDDSLLSKTVAHVVTPEQASKLRALRDALCAGSHIGLNRLTSTEGLEVINSRINFTDNDLLRLSELPGVICLTFAHTQITDAGLAHLKGLAGLRYLQLNETGVTDDGLLHVGQLGLTSL